MRVACSGGSSRLLRWWLDVVAVVARVVVGDGAVRRADAATSWAAGIGDAAGRPVESINSDTLDVASDQPRNTELVTTRY